MSMTEDNTEQRQAFEADMSDDGKWPQAIERDAAGNYLLLSAASAWETWQRAWRAALASEAAVHPTPAPQAQEGQQ